MKEYFGKNKICIYIDQFAASNLFDEPPNDIWAEAANLIDEKFKARKIICPVPSEHFLESANKTKNRAVKIDQKLHILSKGLAFLPEAAIAANYMIAIVRSVPIDQKIFCVPLKHAQTMNQQGAFDGFKAQHQDLNEKVTEAAAGANELRKILSQKKFPREIMESMYQATKIIQVRSFSERLAELIVNGHIISRGVNFANGQVIHWVDLILQILLWQHKITIEECTKLLHLVYNSGFEKIPPLDIRTSLTANLAIEHKKETINDQIDIMRLSSGLPSADLVFTDKQRKFELAQTKLDKKYRAEIFSGTTNDLESFRDRLKSI